MFGWFFKLFRGDTLEDDYKNDYVTDPWDTSRILVYIHNDGKLPDYFSACVFNAVDQWNKARNVEFRITTKRDQAHIKIYAHDLKGRTAGYAWHPQTADLGGHVRIDSSDRVWTGELLTSVIAHEIGHALGLRHNGKRGSIMFWKVAPRKRVTVWDLERLDRLYAGVGR